MEISKLHNKFLLFLNLLQGVIDKHKANLLIKPTVDNVLKFFNEGNLEQAVASYKELEIYVSDATYGADKCALLKKLCPNDFAGRKKGELHF